MDIYPDERRIRSAPEYSYHWFGMKGLLAASAVTVLGLFVYFMDDINVFLSGDEGKAKTVALATSEAEEPKLTPVEKAATEATQEFTTPAIHAASDPAPAKEVTAEIGGDEAISQATPPTVLPEERSAPTKTVAVENEPTPAPEKITFEEDAPPPPPKVAVQEKMEAPKQTLEAVHEKPIVKKAAISKPKSTEVAALKSPDKNQYALQLLGGSDKRKVQKFIQDQKLGNKAIIAKTKHGKQDWYIVLYGNYSNRDQALLEAKKLPKSMKDVQPWPRKFADAGTILRD